MRVRIFENQENEKVKLIVGEKEILKVFESLPDYPLNERLQAILNRIKDGYYSLILPDKKHPIAYLSENIFILCVFRTGRIAIGIIYKNNSWKQWITAQFRYNSFKNEVEGKKILNKARTVFTLLFKELKSNKHSNSIEKVESLKSILLSKF